MRRGVHSNHNQQRIREYGAGQGCEKHHSGQWFAFHEQAEECQLFCFLFRLSALSVGWRGSVKGARSLRGKAYP